MTCTYTACIYRKKKPPLERTPKELLEVRGSVRISVVRDWPAAGLYFSTRDDLEALAEQVSLYVKALQEQDIAHTVIFAPFGVYVMPVKHNTVTSFGNTWTFYEMMGYILLYKPEMASDQRGMINLLIALTYRLLNISKTVSTMSKKIQAYLVQSGLLRISDRVISIEMAKVSHPLIALPRDEETVTRDETQPAQNNAPGLEKLDCQLKRIENDRERIIRRPMS